MNTTKQALDSRTYWRGADGELYPSRQGYPLPFDDESLSHLEEVVRLFRAALKAQD